MSYNKQQTAVEWLIDQFWNNEGMLTSKKLEKALEIEKDQIEAAIIKDCATESTSAAHKKEVHRQQIMEAYIAAKMERNKVKKHFAYFLKLERVQIAAQEYYNQTYGDGVQ
jgi:hypothetical protein